VNERVSGDSFDNQDLTTACTSVSSSLKNNLKDNYFNKE